AIREVGARALEVIVRIIECMSVAFELLRAQDGVEKDLFHAVTKATVARDAQQVAGQLQVRVASTGRLEAAVGRAERGIQVVAVRPAEIFLGAPAARGEALR